MGRTEECSGKYSEGFSRSEKEKLVIVKTFFTSIHYNNKIKNVIVLAWIKRSRSIYKTMVKDLQERLEKVKKSVTSIHLLFIKIRSIFYLSPLTGYEKDKRLFRHERREIYKDQERLILKIHMWLPSIYIVQGILCYWPNFERKKKWQNKCLGENS